MFTRKLPGVAASETWLMASSEVLTNGSSVSCTTYPYAIRNIMDAVVLQQYPRYLLIIDWEGTTYVVICSLNFSGLIKSRFMNFCISSCSTE